MISPIKMLLNQRGFIQRITNNPTAAIFRYPTPVSAAFGLNTPTIPGGETADFYVSKSGNNSWDGTARTFQGGSVGPKLTIGAGLSAIGFSAGAGADKKVLIIDSSAAVYVENFTGGSMPSGTSGHPFTLKAENTGIVSVRPSGVIPFNMGSGGNVTFKNLIIDGVNAPAADRFCMWLIGASGWIVESCEVINSSMSGIMINNDGVIVRGCHIHDCGATQLDHGIYVEAADCILEDNHIHLTGGYNIHAFTTGGPNLDNNIVRRNRCHDPGQSGNNAVGILLANGANQMAYNNLVYDCSHGCDVDGGASGTKFYNNTIYNCSDKGISVGSGTGTIATNNIIYQCTTPTAGSITLTTNLTTDPHFLNEAGRDFHLTVDSTDAIDQGTSLAGIFPDGNKDYDLVSRPQGSGWDIGAYEKV